MAAQVLDRRTAVRIPRFAIVGFYAPLTSQTWVVHAALCAADCNAVYGDDISCWHMAPPLRFPAGYRHFSSDADAQCETHVIAYVDDLTPGEAAKIETWIGNLDTVTPTFNEGVRTGEQYTIHPHARMVRDVTTGTRRFRRFSCAGFVVDCYRAARLPLLPLDTRQLPACSQAELISVYAFLSNPIAREDFGVGNAGPWALTLPGYLFHSLLRAPEEVRRCPYIPASVQEARFPTPPAPPTSAPTMPPSPPAT